MKKFVLLAGLVAVLCCITLMADAQCAMCGTTVNTSAGEGGKSTAGLNTAILYMLAIPYLAFMGIGILWYKKYRRKQIVMQMEENKISLN
ncbi:MAG: hypothetical protein FWJ85_01740 [Solitalea sp.]